MQDTNDMNNMQPMLYSAATIFNCYRAVSSAELVIDVVLTVHLSVCLLRCGIISTKTVFTAGLSNHSSFRQRWKNFFTQFSPVAPILAKRDTLKLKTGVRVSWVV